SLSCCSVSRRTRCSSACFSCRAISSSWSLSLSKSKSSCKEKSTELSSCGERGTETGGGCCLAGEGRGILLRRSFLVTWGQWLYAPALVSICLEKTPKPGTARAPISAHLPAPRIPHK